MTTVNDFVVELPFVAGQVLTPEAATFLNQLVASIREIEARVTDLEP